MDDLSRRLADAFHWREGGESAYADPSGWWRDGDLLRDTAGALAALHEPAGVTAVAGIQSRGFILGTAVALSLGVGFLDIRKDRKRSLEPTEMLLRSTTPPDYNDRGLVLTLNRHVIAASDRVLLVDEWMRTGAQATAARDLIEAAEAKWIGAAIILDDISSDVRRRLNVRSLLRNHELPW